MNVLVIGGSGSLINNLIIKLNKEGHRVYLLTGSRYTQEPYQKVFERYNFTYDSSCLNEIFESVTPDLTIYLGAFDSNFRWGDEEAASVKYSACLMNILMGYAMRGHGRFLYLSSEAVYGRHYPENVGEAIAQYHPTDVDVSSGIEAAERAADGRTRKDPAKMRRFMANVHNFGSAFRETDRHRHEDDQSG